MRKITIKDDKLKQYLEEREQLANEMTEHSKNLEKITEPTEKLRAEIEALKEKFNAKFAEIKPEVEKLNEKMKPIMNKYKRYEDKVKPIIDKQNIELEEYEEIASTFLEDGVPTIKITNQLEEYKKVLDAKKSQDKTK